MTLEPGKDQRFLCNSISRIMGVDENREEIQDRYGQDLYFCSGAWSSEVKAYYGEGAWGVDPRFTVGVVKEEHKGQIWKDGGKRYLWLLNVTISNVQFSDTGVYFCGWAIRGKDAYQEVQIHVVQVDAELTIMKQIIASLFLNPVSNLPQDASMKDVDFIMSSDLGDDIKEVRAANVTCEGNDACALTFLQREVLKSEVDGECWICIQLHAAWTTYQITPETVCFEKNKCEV